MAEEEPSVSRDHTDPELGEGATLPEDIFPEDVVPEDVLPEDEDILSEASSMFCAQSTITRNDLATGSQFAGRSFKNGTIIPNILAQGSSFAGGSFKDMPPPPKPGDGLPESSFISPDLSPVDGIILPQFPISSETDIPPLSTLDAQPQPTKIPQGRSDREPSIERCVGCNEAWRRPIPDMDQGPLASAENNADYMRLASTMIDRLRDQRKKADAAYEEWKWRHSHCYRPVSPFSTGSNDTPMKRRPESPHERHTALKRPKITDSPSLEPLVVQLGQATSTEDGLPGSHNLEHIGSDTLSPQRALSVGTGQPRCHCLSITDTDRCDAEETRHWLSESDAISPESWESFRETLPESYKWDVEYHATAGTNQRSRGCWTYASSDNNVMSHIPLTIANVPVVLPVQYRWPPVGGIQPPPDPRPFLPIDYRAELSMETIQDIFLTFEGSIGFYLLINGLLQILVPATFDTAWASSHLPHKFGGLRVCYIEQSLEETMIPSQVQTSRSRSPLLPLSSLFRPSRSAQPLQINDLIEARTGSSTREKFSGRIGMKVVSRQGEPLLLMSSHVITAAILGKSFLGTNWNPLKRLRDDWNDHAEIWAGGAKVG
jgi:hypothetical protein